MEPAPGVPSLPFKSPPDGAPHVSSRCVGPTGRKLRGPENVEEVELEKEKEKEEEEEEEEEEERENSTFVCRKRGCPSKVQRW